MADRILTVTLNNAGNPRIRFGNNDATSFLIDPDDRLGWECLDTGKVAKFAVLFSGQDSPFKSGRKAFSGEKGNPSDVRMIRRAKQGEIRPKFKYHVVVLKDNDTTSSVDPEIIIDDQGGGEGTP